MKVLVLGGDGMLGHELFQQIRDIGEARVTLRQDRHAYASYGIFDSSNAFYSVDLRDPMRLVDVLGAWSPDAVVNAAGIVKQRTDNVEAAQMIEVNALMPRRLASLCKAIGARLIHISTDCVFSGDRGGYREADHADARDLYGLSKLLGEVAEPPCLTLRTSMIGLELSRKTSLLEWFLAQRGTIKGFRRAIFTGFTTQELSRIIVRMLQQHTDGSGLYHVSSEPIDKYTLLCMIRDALGIKIEIIPDDTFECDRSLDSSRFRAEFNYNPPTWQSMIDELAITLNDRK